jgi:hypothetical protein
MTQVIEHLSRKCEALSSDSSTSKTNKEMRIRNQILLIQEINKLLR